MKKIDVITIVGYILAFGSLLASLVIAEGSFSGLKVIWNMAGFIAAFGGASAGVIVQMGPNELKSLFKVTSKAFAYEPVSVQAIFQDLLRYANMARKAGILALENEAQATNDEFLKRGLLMAVDGMSPEAIEQMMMTELKTLQERHDNGRRVVELMATFCPAFGMLGTIMHLALVLTKLDNPKAVGPAMASALLTTFYGVLGCYAVFTPLAKKLERRSKEEIYAKKLIIRGLVAIQAGDSARIVERKLKIFLKGRA